MSRVLRIATVIGSLGTCWGAGWAVYLWREQMATGQPPPFMLEGLALVVAPPFGFFLSYLFAALLNALPATDTVAQAAALNATWTLLTAAANWALVGCAVAAADATLADFRADRRRRAAR